MAKLITESNFEILTESDQKKNLYITGIFSSAEKKNKNGRIYPKGLLEREITKLQEMTKQGTVIGELSHPESRAESLLKEAAICTEELWWENNNVMGRSKVLQNTPNGYILKGLIEDGVKIGISSRGLGTVNEETKEVNEDFSLICYDCVSNPSNFGSWVDGILEGKEFDTPTDTKTYSYEDVKSLMNENKYIKKLDPLVVKKLLDEGHTPEMIKDYIDNKLEEHYKKIWQVLENI